MSRGFVNILLLVVLGACAATITKPRPGDRPGPSDPGAATRPGRRPPPVAPDPKYPFQGNWQSACASDRWTDSSGNVYASSQVFLTITETSMVTSLIRFKGANCDDINQSKEILPQNTWDFTTNEEGTVGGAAWLITYTSYNGQAFTFEDGIVMGTPTSLYFESEAFDGLSYSRN